MKDRPQKTLFLLPLLFFLFSASAHAQRSPGVGFAMVGIAPGQTARVNALNLGKAQSPRSSSCNVTLQFLDSKGQVLKEATLDVQAGSSGSLDLTWDAKHMHSPRAEVRATVLYGYAGGANPSPLVMQSFDCTIVPSLEIFKTDEGMGSIILTDTKPLPATGPAAQ